ncbi:hypothetical protein EXN66_Car006166 [Channa argus]|uniref:Uncharacterized protein n=1 Tax=Channa argus TaxID=215402 RepID=A0A6G1PJX3_CHAAH|nr:hypothetical protein EXN66_Car006166 [Channa argus]KAK2908296.1 hypothetical protein Q8A73_009369 [Channa argus]
MAKSDFRDASSLLLLQTLLLPSLIAACTLPDSLPDGEASQTSLSCFRSTKPNVRNVDLLYDANSDEGRLWVGNGPTPHCSSTSKPAPSSCEVCSVEFVHVVCCRLPKSTMPVMEGAGRPIDLVQSECPQLLAEGAKQHSGTGNHSGGPRWWQLLLIFSTFLIIITGR